MLPFGSSLDQYMSSTAHGSATSRDIIVRLLVLLFMPLQNRITPTGLDIWLFWAKRTLTPCFKLFREKREGGRTTN